MSVSECVCETADDEDVESPPSFLFTAAAVAHTLSPSVPFKFSSSLDTERRERVEDDEDKKKKKRGLKKLMVTLWWNWTHSDLLVTGEKEHSQFLTASMSNSPVIHSISPTSITLNELQLFTDLRYLRIIIKENYPHRQSE